MDLWHGLHVGCQYLCMLPQIQSEGIACPSALGFDNIKGDPPEEVFEGGSDSNTMPLERVKAGCPGCLGQPRKKLWFGEGAMGILVSVCEEVGVGWRVVDGKMVLQCCFWV